MEHAQKMYLVPQQQLNLLKRPSTQESIRESVENELDRTIKDILDQKTDDLYGKAKKYSAALQRYLTVVKQGEREQNTLTLSLPDDSNAYRPEPFSTDTHDISKDSVFNEVLRNIPKNSKKNAQHILDKMTSSQPVTSWTKQGEFVFKGNVVEGSHVYDLIKNVTAAHNVPDSRRPIGWSEYLQSLALLNIPLSTVPNQLVKRQIVEFKKHTSVTPDRATRRHVGTSPFSTPAVRLTDWVDF